MSIGLLARALGIAALAAGLVWLVTIATFRPFDTASDTRPYCSGGAALPNTVNGVEVHPTFSPGCHGGPIPADAVRPWPLPAVATFVLFAVVGLIIVGNLPSRRGSAEEDG